MSLKDELITPIIKGRKVIYHLVTEDDLDNLSWNNIFQDILLILFAVALGSAISNANIFYFWLGLIPLCLALIFGYRKFKFILKTKKSVELDIYKDTAEKGKIGGNKNFDIIQVIYGSSTNYVDITEKIKRLIKDDKFIYNGKYNSITGEQIDPHKKARKQLKIKYVYNGFHFYKEFTESEPINLPL